MIRPSEFSIALREHVAHTRLARPLRPLLLPWFIVEAQLILVEDVVLTPLQLDLVGWLFFGALYALMFL